LFDLTDDLCLDLRGEEASVENDSGHSTSPGKKLTAIATLSVPGLARGCEWVKVK
jgi:hypothetical protein